MGPDLWEMFEDGAGDDEVAAILRLGHAGTLPKGVRLITQFGEIVTIRTTRSNILNVSAAPEVAEIAAGDTYLGPDVEAAETTGSAELSSDTVLDTDGRRPPDEKATGRGVVVGLVDWGFDFAHPDFLKPDGSSRILAIWDQRGSKLPNSPQPFGYGAVHDQDAINRALKQPDPYAALGYHPADADTGIGSHGTHVLSIAAGSGGEERPVGVAPEADLVVVHNAPWDEIDTGRLGDSVTLLEGVDFIARLAGDRPWVINLSMGKHGEQHDGSTLIEQGLDAAIRSSAGRAVCLSAGNYFDKRIHASGQLRPTQERTLIWEIQENKPTNNQLEFWYSWQDKFEVRVKSPDGAISARAAIGERSKFLVGGKEVGNIYHRGQEPNNLDNHIVIYLYKDAPTGEWEITLVGDDVIDGRYHAWIERDVSCSRCQSRLREGDADPHCTTGTICNGRRTLAVGAYNKHDPEMRLAHFSSVGPTRDGRLKPDLCAPGVAILAARSAPRERRDPPQLCTRMSGTSMAAPCVTGTIALMFQAAPRRLRIEETHNIILQSARKVSVPEEIPERIGIGFLDIEEAVDAARKLPPLVSSFKQTTVHSAPTEKPKEQTRQSETATSEAVASEGFSPGAALAVALSLPGGSMSGSPDSEAKVAVEVAPFSFDENYGTSSGQPARSAGAEWAELADEIVADMGEEHSVKVLHEMFERSDDLSDLATDTSGNAPSAAQIFDALVYSGNPKLRQQLTQNFQVVALPKEPAAGKVCAGDIMVRRTDGLGGHVSIVAAPGLKNLASLNAEGLVAESDTPGQYVQVIEGGGEFAHESEDKYARQLADSFGRVLNDIVLLRLATPTQSVVTVNQTAPAVPPTKDPDGGEFEAQSGVESEIFNDNDLRYDMTELPPVQTRHQVVVNGSVLKYMATAGRLPIKSGDGQTRAQMFYVAYTLDGQEAAKRPLTFLFNGGPGSASLWLHMGAMGPRKVALQPEGFLPPAPYHFESNPNTLLDKSDLVFVDAIGTGFSRAADSRSFGYFWGVRGDIEAFSEFIRLFITRNERWGSPLFLFGESYGTLRAAGIAGYLSGKGISFSGITLLSTVLNYQTLEATKTNDQPYIFLVPTYTMIAGYHHKLPADLASDMNRARREAEQWASSEYARALAKGDALTPVERQQAIDQMARYTGLSKDVIDEANLRIDVRKFTHYLLLEKKLRVGRFDGRFTGTDPQGLLDTQYYDPTEAATHPPFTSVFNNYVRSELGYKTDMPYYTRAQDADADSWNWGSAINGFPDTATALREAIVKNPYLRILVMEGLYDLATPYSAADYTVDHLDLPARYRDNISVATYEAGHMVYLPEAGLKKMKADEADFVARSVAPQKQTARESSENAGTSEDDDSSLLLALNGVSLQDIGNGFLGQVPADTQAAILSRGETDAKALADMTFWQKYPKFAGKKLDEKDSAQASLRREWSNLYFRGIRPLIWLRAMINELDKYRGNIPREFLLGWIAWESSGDLKSFTTLGELGYFQIMWRSGEAKEQLHMTAEEFPKLSTDPDFSVAKGVALAQAYRDYVSKNYPDIAENSDLQLRLTKGRHAASGVLRDALRRLEKASTPITWASVSKVLPGWMVDNIGNTMNYAAKLKPLSDLVPVVAKTGREGLTERIAEDDGVVGGADRVRISPTTAAPWRWMCNVYACDFKYLCDSPNEATSRGSGVLISNYHVLTAAHVVWDAAASGQMTVRVWPGRDGENEPFGSAIARKVRVCPKYNPSNDDSEEWDYALITLETPVGSTPAKALANASPGFWGSAESSIHTTISSGDPLIIMKSQAITAGYPANVDQGKQLLCAKGRLHSIGLKKTPNLMFTTATTTQGQSGSPFWIEKDGELSLVGLSIEAGSSMNRVLRVTLEMLDQLAAWFAADGEPPWFPNRTDPKNPHTEIAAGMAAEDDRSRQNNQLTMALPQQPARCTGVMTFYERPTYQLFLNDVKKVIRTCVQEGRENELLDNNDSLVSAWNELQLQPISMALGEARKIQVVPQYDWERTSGPPYWRATRITFLVQRKKTPAPPIKQVDAPDDKKDKPQPPIPPPQPPCANGKDCRPTSPAPTTFETWYYCTESGVKSVKVPKGHAPPAQADALTGFYQSNAAARLECFKYQKNIIDPPAGGPGPSGIGDALRDLKSVMPLFLLFGSVAIFGEADFLMESMIEVFELAEALKAMLGGPKEVLFELNRDRVRNRLSVNVILDGTPQDLQTYIENLKKSGTIGQYDYDYLKSLANDVEIKMQNLDAARSLGFARQQGTWVRGQFIEDIYIQEKLRSRGYVGLPDWFKGYDAFKEGARFDPPVWKDGKYVTTFYDPDLISIKSYEPEGGLKNIDLAYLDKQMDKWIEKMKGSEFEKDKVKIVLSGNKNQAAARKNEVHLVVLGDEDVSQFRDKLEGVARLAAKKRISLKVIQYVKATTRFTSLL